MKSALQVRGATGYLLSVVASFGLAFGALVFGGGVVPASAGGVLFSDDFETGSMAAWTTQHGVVAENTDAFAGVYAAEALSTGAAVYARRMLAAPVTSVGYSLQFKVVSRTTPANVMAVRPVTGAAVAAVSINKKGKLALKVAGVTTVGPAVAADSTWRSLSLHVQSGATQVTLDGVTVLTSSASLSTAVSQVELGDPVANHQFDVRFDDVSVADPTPDDTTAPSAPANVTAVATDHQVYLSWDAATDDVGVTGYNIYRDGTQIASVGASTTYPDRSVAAETTYAYQVQARDGAGNVSSLSDPPVSATTPPASTNPVRIAAAGDIACPSSGAVTATTCQQAATSDLLVSGQFDRVLPLGDNQYDNGTLSEYLGSYDPTWGRLKAITAPVPGNHEYVTAGASGYYDYFGGAAGNPSKGYYSFDLGAWHLIALNSNCAKLGPADGCAAGTPQETWLKADLAAHSNTCTLAYWHHPLASSGSHGGIAAVKPFWDALYAAGADVVLNGHSHNYERFVPLNPSKASDPVNGIREFVVGTGGEDHNPGSATPPATSEVRNFDTFGVLDLTLNANSYDWNFAPIAGSTFTDSGTGTCH